MTSPLASLPPRLALRRSEAAAALGISDETFDARVRPHLRVVRLGTLRLYPVAELDRFLTDSADPSPADEIGGAR